MDLTGRCESLRAGLPVATLAAVTCRPADAPVDVAAIYLFNTRDEMLAAYGTWLEEHGISIRQPSGGCATGRPAEEAYVPGDDGGPVLVERQACQVDADGTVRVAFTKPPFVLATVEGHGDPEAVQRWPWLGNRDQPGAPTLWSEFGPLSPEK